MLYCPSVFLFFGFSFFLSGNGRPEPGYKRACCDGLGSHFSKDSGMQEFLPAHSGQCNCQRGYCAYIFTAPGVPNCYWLLAQDRLIKRVKALGKLTVNSAVLTKDNYLTLDKIPILNLLQTPHFMMQKPR